MSQTAPGAHWKNSLPPERAYKRRAGAVSPAVEQDRAAGGRDRRRVAVGNGLYARASVTLRLYRRTRRIRAYLRWSQDGTTVEKYICEVSADARRQNLTEAWRKASERGLLVDQSLPPQSTASSIKVRASMRGNRHRDTQPELQLRSMLHRRGLRYLVDARPIAEVPRRADLVFPGCQVAVFVDGCYWHGCPDHYRPATRNADFWRNKIDGNRARDNNTNNVLRAAGWTVFRVWEHEDLAEAALLIETTVREKRALASQSCLMSGYSAQKVIDD